MFGMGDICYNSLDVFTLQLASALRGIGCEVDILEVHGNKGYSEKLIEMFEKRHYDAAISFNSAGEGSLKFKNGEYLFDHYKIPYLLYLIDHPMDHIEKILDSGRYFHTICIDRDHVEYLKKGFPAKSECFFALPGGIAPSTETDISHDAFEKRKYSLVFTGSRTDLNEVGKKIDNISPALKNIAFKLLELLLSCRHLNMEQALDIILKDTGINASDTEAAAMEAMLNSVNIYARAYVREEAVRFIMASGFPFDIFGTGWDSVAEESAGNVTVHKPVSYGDIPELYLQSKLVLNVMPWFKNGSHDRIPMAMLAGAVAMTDHSRLLDEWFLKDKENGKRLVFYDIEHPEMLPEMITDVLSDDKKLSGIAGRGYEYAVKNLTWKKTAEDVIDIVRKVEMIHG